MDTKTPSPTSSTSTVTDLLSVALSVGAVIWAAAAGAASAQTTPTSVERISIADLDLSTADGARAFLKRVDIAAQTACGGEPVRSPLFPREPGHFEKCVTEAIATAVRNAGDPMVAQTLAGSTTLASR